MKLYFFLFNILFLASFLNCERSRINNDQSENNYRIQRSNGNGTFSGESGYNNQDEPEEGQDEVASKEQFISKYIEQDPSLLKKLQSREESLQILIKSIIYSALHKEKDPKKIKHIIEYIITDPVLSDKQLEILYKNKDLIDPSKQDLSKLSNVLLKNKKIGAEDAILLEQAGYLIDCSYKFTQGDILLLKYLKNTGTKIDANTCTRIFLLFINEKQKKFIVDKKLDINNKNLKDIIQIMKFNPEISEEIAKFALYIGYGENKRFNKKERDLLSFAKKKVNDKSIKKNKENLEKQLKIKIDRFSENLDNKSLKKLIGLDINFFKYDKVYLVDVVKDLYKKENIKTKNDIENILEIIENQENKDIYHNYDTISNVYNDIKKFEEPTESTVAIFSRIIDKIENFNITPANLKNIKTYKSKGYKNDDIIRLLEHDIQPTNKNLIHKEFIPKLIKYIDENKNKYGFGHFSYFTKNKITDILDTYIPYLEKCELNELASNRALWLFLDIDNFKKKLDINQPKEKDVIKSLIRFLSQKNLEINKLEKNELIELNKFIKQDEYSDNQKYKLIISGYYKNQNLDEIYLNEKYKECINDSFLNYETELVPQTEDIDKLYSVGLSYKMIRDIKKMRVYKTDINEILKLVNSKTKKVDIQKKIQEGLDNSKKILKPNRYLS